MLTSDTSSLRSNILHWIRSVPTTSPVLSTTAWCFSPELPAQNLPTTTSIFRLGSFSQRCCYDGGVLHHRTHTHPFNGPLSGATRVSRYQKSKTNLDFTEARDGEWQRHQLGYVQVCTSLQADNHASTPQLSFYREDALPATQPTVSNTAWQISTTI